MAAGAGGLGFPVLPGKPRAPQPPEAVYSGGGATHTQAVKVLILSGVPEIVPPAGKKPDSPPGVPIFASPDRVEVYLEHQANLKLCDRVEGEEFFADLMEG